MNKRDAKLSSELDDASSHLLAYVGGLEFIEPTEIHSILNRYSSVKDDADRRSRKITYALGLVDKTLKSRIIGFKDAYDSFPAKATEHNERLAQDLAVDVGKRINPVEGRNLDEQQLKSIAYDVNSRLVIAGAGTGKTTTIVGLVKELLFSGKANAEEILLLSFTNASVNELKSRIQRRPDSALKLRPSIVLALR